MIIEVNPENPQQRLLDKITEVLKSGGVIIYPTDTQYGLGCDLTQKKAIEKIYQIKKRDLQAPFSFICSDLSNISQYAKVSNFAYRTLKRVFPGPFTVILNGSKEVPKIMLSKREECGIRVPNHPITLGIIKTLGNPIINTSAAKDGKPAPTTIHELQDLFKGQVDLFVDGGPVPGQPSTVVSLIDDDNPVIIRQGLGIF